MQLVKPVELLEDQPQTPVSGGFAC